MIKILSTMWLVGFLVAQSGWAASSAHHARHSKRAVSAATNADAGQGQKPKTRHTHRKRSKKPVQNTNTPDAPMTPDNTRK